MVQLQSSQSTEIIYPDSDGKPMADNTKQFRWIVVIQQNLEDIYANDPNVFVAGDLFWYPVEGRNRIVQAPDIMVALGRPKGDRGSYKQWQEGGIAPQVVFEILSPCNSRTDMEKKLLFYDRYGVEEYYIYDPDTNELKGWLRTDLELDVIETINGWVSPRLGIRFDLSREELQIERPDGTPFLSYTEVRKRLTEERQRAEEERQRAEEAQQRLEEMQALLQQYRDRFGDLS